MLEALFWFVIGAFVGWNFPQPSWAKDIQQRVFKFFERK